MYYINRTEEFVREGFPHIKPLIRSFTLVELIIVVIIVGILASLGLTQYNLVVEKSRLAEAKVRIGTMRQLAYSYYLENGTVTGMQDADVGADNTCSSTGFYAYDRANHGSGTYARLGATRCTSGGKTPNASKQYYYYMHFWPGTGQIIWSCHYTDDNSSCFGLPAT